MAVALVGSVGSATGTTSPITGAYGQTPTAGNVLVAVLTVTSQALETFSPTCSTTGWARLAGPFPNNTGGTSHAGVDFWWKLAVGSDAAPAFTQTVATGYLTVNIFELSGANYITPLDTSGSYASGSTALTSAPTMTPTTAAAVKGISEYAVVAYVQDTQATGTQASFTDLGSGFTSKFFDGATSLNGHTQINIKAAPAAGSTVADSGHFASGTANTYAAAGTVVISASVKSPSITPDGQDALSENIAFVSQAILQSSTW